MPVSIRLSEDGSRVTIESTGRVTDAEYLDAHLTHYSRPIEDLLKVRRVLSDWSQATAIEVTAPSVRRIAEESVGAVKRALRAGLTPPPIRKAFLAPSDVAFGLARMFAILEEGSQSPSHVFRDRDEALAWLERTPDEIG